MSSFIISAPRFLFRALALAGAIGLFLGALVMGAEGLSRIGPAMMAVARHEAAHGAVVAVMTATDELLFAVVLGVMALAVAFNFVLDAATRDAKDLPNWLHVHDLAEIKHILVELVLVYLIVDFVTDVADGEHAADWGLMIKPAAVLVIAVAAFVMRSAGLTRRG